MERVMQWLRMMGTTGAVLNARSLSEERERERWMVDALLLRLSIREQEAAAAA